MKTISKFTIIIILLGYSTISIHATPGRLKKNSIIECGGVNYGFHGADKHWHVAVKGTGDWWDAVGEPLSTKPCVILDSPEDKDNDIVEEKPIPPVPAQPPSGKDEPKLPVQPPTNKEDPVKKPIPVESIIPIDEKPKVTDDIPSNDDKNIEKVDNEVNIKDSSIEIKSIKLDNVTYSKDDIYSDENLKVSNSKVIVDVIFKEKSPSFKSTQNNLMDFFENGLIEVNLTSANKESSETLNLSVLRLPSEKDVIESRDIGLMFENQIFNYNDLKEGLPQSLRDETNLDDLKFVYKEKEIPINYDISFIKNNDGDSILVNIDGYDDYLFPYTAKEDISENSLLETIISSIIGLGLLVGGTLFFVKKIKKNKPIVPQTLVSVIIPTNNSKSLITDTINSVLTQSHNSLEIIIIDDNSIDENNNLINEMIKSDDRIRLISKNKSKGLLDSLMSGIELAKSDYTTFILPGDLWQNNKIEKQIKYMQKKKVGFTYTDFEKYDLATNKSLGKQVTPDSINYRFAKKNDVIAWSTVMLNKSIVSDIKISRFIKNDEKTLLNNIIKKIKSGSKVSGLSVKVAHK